MTSSCSCASRFVGIPEQERGLRSEQGDPRSIQEAQIIKPGLRLERLLISHVELPFFLQRLKSTQLKKTFQQNNIKIER